MILRTIGIVENDHFSDGFVLGYYLNVIQNENSIMVRMHGLFAYDAPGFGTRNDVQCILMENFLPFPSIKFTYIFDIKGDAKRFKVTLRKISK
jgi:hypothetical protein